MDKDLVKRTDGKYEEKLGDIWIAEYAEDPATGLWEVQIFKHGGREWHGAGYATLEESQRAAHELYAQS